MAENLKSRELAERSYLEFEPKLAKYILIDTEKAESTELSMLVLNKVQNRGRSKTPIAHILLDQNLVPTDIYILPLEKTFPLKKKYSKRSTLARIVKDKLVAKYREDFRQAQARLAEAKELLYHNQL